MCTECNVFERVHEVLCVSLSDNQCDKSCDASSIICHVIMPMYNRMLSICNIHKLVLMMFEDHRFHSCECREVNRA